MKKDKFDFSEEMDKVDRSIDTARRQEAERPDGKRRNMMRWRKIWRRCTN